jgi:PTH1 family peptidyl-tRNA hydrolase
MKYLIVGLGNIGVEYQDTRHNIGFMMADALVEACKGPAFVSDRYGAVSECKFKGRVLLVLKPSTYMNLSGKAVRYWMAREHIPTEQVLVLVDDLALPFGTIRMRSKGSPGGHNGLASIVEQIGSQDFPRLRFGIGDTFHKGAQIDYVLSPFAREEWDQMPERLRMVSEAVQSFVTIGVERTMNFYNNK